MKEEKLKLTPEQKKENKIRQRTSYQNYRKLYDKINPLAKGHEETFEILNIIDGEIDSRYGYGSQRNSEAATESIKLLKKDKEREDPWIWAEN